MFYFYAITIVPTEITPGAEDKGLKLEAQSSGKEVKITGNDN